MRTGAVATSQPLAASAGLALRRAGGSAVDAAIATATALTIVHRGPNESVPDLFAIVWDGKRLHGLNASGRVASALTGKWAKPRRSTRSSARWHAGSAADVMPSRDGCQ